MKINGNAVRLFLSVVFFIATMQGAENTANRVEISSADLQTTIATLQRLANQGGLQTIALAVSNVQQQTEVAPPPSYQESVATSFSRETVVVPSAPPFPATQTASFEESTESDDAIAPATQPTPGRGIERDQNHYIEEIMEKYKKLEQKSKEDVLAAEKLKPVPLPSEIQPAPLDSSRYTDYMNGKRRYDESLAEHERYSRTRIEPFIVAEPVALRTSSSQQTFGTFNGSEEKKATPKDSSKCCSCDDCCECCIATTCCLLSLGCCFQDECCKMYHCKSKNNNKETCCEKSSDKTCDIVACFLMVIFCWPLICSK